MEAVVGPLTGAQQIDALQGQGISLPSGALTSFRETGALTAQSSYLDGHFKRSLDLVLGVLLLVFLAPALVLIAVAIKSTSRGPVFFRQMRGGRGQTEFAIWKFRTMRHEPAPEGTDFVRQASRQDDRITPLGCFLRRFSLDELPQFINVVRGEMSLVGPRPHAICHDGFFAAQIPDYTLRYVCKPGITGMAQVGGARGETGTVGEMKRRVDLDLRYIGTASLQADLTILMQTAWKIFVSDEAY